MKSRVKRLGCIISSAAILAASCYCSITSFAAGTEVTASDSHTVYSDTFEGEELNTDWVWAAREQNKDEYTAAIADGQLDLYGNSGSGVVALRYLNLSRYKKLNQRVSLEFTAEFNKKPVLWARTAQKFANNYNTVNGYYVTFNCSATGFTEMVLSKRDEAFKVTRLGYCGKPTVTAGQKYRMEMVTQGNSPTLISVYLYKVTATGETVVANSSYVDNEECLQDAGSVGISALVSNSATIGNSVKVDSFEYTSTDDVTGNYYVSKTTVGERKTFGQVLALDSTKKYIFAVTSKDNGQHATDKSEMVNPLWLEYYNTSKACSRALTDRKLLIGNRTAEAVGDSGVEYNEYFTVYYEFDLSAVEDKEENVQISDGTATRTRVIAGFRIGAATETYLSANYTNFRLYAADDTSKTNLLVNPDFKMGLYGWSDSATACVNYNVQKESEVTAKNGFVTFNSISSDYDKYSLFKNKSFTVVVGDANKDTVVNILDLVRCKKISSSINPYGVAVDYDCNGLINAADIVLLKNQIMDMNYTVPTQLNYSANAILNSESASAITGFGGEYTADYQ